MTAGAAALVAVGGYVKFVFEPTLLPSAEVDVWYTELGRVGGLLYGEIDITVTNVGKSRLWPVNIRCRVGWFGDEPATVPVEAQNEQLGAEAQNEQLGATKSYTPERLTLEADRRLRLPRGPDPLRGFRMATGSTLVQPGVTQHYRRPVILPGSTRFVFMRARLDFANNHKGVRRRAADWLARHALERDDPDAASTPSSPTAASTPSSPTAASTPSSPTAASTPSSPTAPNDERRPTEAPPGHLLLKNFEAQRLTAVLGLGAQWASPEGGCAA